MYIIRGVLGRNVNRPHICSLREETSMNDRALSTLVEKLQAVCVFTGDIVSTDDPVFQEIGGLRSSSGLEEDASGPVFSYQRVLAAAIIWGMNNSIKIVPSGGRTNIVGKGHRPISAVVSFELTRLLGLPDDAIVEEPFALNTGEQVRRCAAKVSECGWDPGRVAILAPCWQFPRINAMLTLMSDIQPFAVGVTRFISMERVLSREDPQWNQTFIGWYSTPQARKMFAKEALGTGQLLVGHQPKYPVPFRGFHDPLTI